MLRNRKLGKLDICRRCLNTYSKIKFKNYELKYKYYYYHSECSKCQGMHHIVRSVKPMYMWKLLFVNKPTDIGMPPDDPEVAKAIRRKRIKAKLKKWFTI